MTVAMVMQFDGVDARKYDAVQKELGLEGAKADWPQGLISHTAGRSPEGWCVLDVWDSQADVDAFVRGRLGPTFGKLGNIPQPKVTTIVVHNFYRRRD